MSDTYAKPEQVENPRPRPVPPRPIANPVDFKAVYAAPDVMEKVEGETGELI